jgi:ubiquinone/menaquinone biosynthesis C-methylase UbiE
MSSGSAVGLPTENPNDELIRNHYKAVAEQHGASPRSSMEDQFVREKEIECITNFYRFVKEESHHPLKVLELGCGNGYTLEAMSSMDRTDQFWGVDFSEELLDIARQRKIPNCVLRRGDARAFGPELGSFDCVYTERCLINILDRDEQFEAFRQIAKVLKPNGYFLMIEGFADGLRNYNKARSECGLSEVPQAIHNLNFEREELFAGIRDLFTIVDGSQMGKYSVPPNFLSSYYFISRVFYPAIAKGEVVRNSEVAKFFSFLPPIGDYSTIQAYILQKK